MRNEVKEFKRQRLFDLYDVRSNPFLFVTTKIDITNIVNYCKIHRMSGISCRAKYRQAEGIQHKDGYSPKVQFKI